MEQHTVEGAPYDATLDIFDAPIEIARHLVFEKVMTIYLFQQYTRRFYSIAKS